MIKNAIVLLGCLFFGILFIWLSKNNDTYKKTAAIQGEENARQKLRIITLCGYVLLLGTCVFGTCAILRF